MAGKKISEFLDAATAKGSDRIPIVREDENYVITVEYIKHHILDGLQISSPFEQLNLFENAFLIADGGSVVTKSPNEIKEILSLRPGVEIQPYKFKLEAFDRLSDDGIIINHGAVNVVRTIIGGNDIEVTNGNGIDGDPTISVGGDISRINQDEVRSAAINMNSHIIKSPVIQGYNEVLEQLLSQENILIDVAVSNVQELVLQSSTVLSFQVPTLSTNVVWSLTLIIKQNNTGGYQLTWPNNVVWSSGIKPFISISPNAMDVYTFLSADGGISWLGFVAGSNFL